LLTQRLDDDDHERREKDKTQNRDRTELCFEKEGVQNCRIEDITKAAGDIGQYADQPGNAGDGRHRRGDTQQ